MLHGEALRAELRRICSLDRVMPPPPEPKPDYEVTRSRYGATDGQLLQRRFSLQAAAAKRAVRLEGVKAQSLAARPKGALHIDEVCQSLGRSKGWFQRRAKAADIQPVKRDFFTWYAAADLRKAGIL